MSVRFAVWAMVVSSALALLAIAAYLFVNLQSIAQQLGVGSGTAKWLHGQAEAFVGSQLSDKNFDKLLGSINMIFQAANACVTFICSRFVSQKLPSVAEANRVWHWVSVVKSAADPNQILRVKRGQMNVVGVHNESERKEHAGKVIAGFDIEIDGQRVDPNPTFNATAIIVGTLDTERIIFNYKYAGGADDVGISNLSLMRSGRRSRWLPFLRGKNKLDYLYDEFLVDGLVGRGEAFYFKTAGRAEDLYNEHLSHMAKSAVQGAPAH